MLARARGILRAAAQRWAPPQRCLFCGGEPRDGICVSCRLDLPRIHALRCPRCRNLSEAGQICGECLGRPPRFSRLAVAVSYRFSVDEAIQRLKYGADRNAVAPLAGLLAQRLNREPPPDLVLAMPVAAQRVGERGFNHAQELARFLGERLRLRLASRICRRIRHTVRQAFCHGPSAAATFAALSYATRT
jgi:predicted amidophosphoribosyltransferase